MSQTLEGVAALKSYVYFAEAQDGVYFGGGTEHFLIKGANIYPLVARLVSLLDGNRSLEAIRNGLPAKARSFFEVLVGQLRDREMLRESAPSSDTISDEEWRLYRETILYMRDRAANYAGLFRTWRARNNVVIGGGLCAKALLRGLARTGAAKLHFLYEPCATGSAQHAELVRVLEEHSTRDDTFSFDEIDASGLERVDPDARLIYASDKLRANAHPELHYAGGFLNEQAIVAGGDGADCPAILSDLAARMTPAQAGDYSAVTAPSIIGNLLAFEILRCEVARFTHNPRAASIGPTHFLHLSPGGEIAPHKLPTRRAAGNAAPGPAAQILDRDALFDPLTGMFERLPALAGHRLPLPHARIRVRLSGGGSIDETAWGITQRQAEDDVLLRAAARLASLARPEAGPFIAAHSFPDWQRAALAAAITHSAVFADAAARTISIDEIVDAEFSFLARIVRFYSEQRPRITLASVPDWHGFVAEAEVGAFNARAVASNSVEALCNALGQACSRMQLAAIGYDMEPLLFTLRTPLNPGLGGAPRLSENYCVDQCLERLARTGLSATPIMHHDDAIAAAGLHVGAFMIFPKRLDA